MNDETIFAVALEKPDAAARAAYLKSACADAEQRKRVEGLLAALEAAGTFLEKPAAAGSVESTDPDAAPTFALRDPGDGPTRTHGEDADHDTDDALGFLAPAGRPDSLGRIGHYEVLEVLGRGAFGIVFRAFDEKLQRVVAVKVLSPSMAATSPARKRFLREARSAAAVRHENVVHIHETGEQPLPYLVMEFVPGETLQQSLDRTGPLDAAEVVRIARQVAEGLAAAHAQGLVHRDIKPSNILIDSGPQRVKITDFGLARAADDASLTRSGVVAGTPMYMAPEQAKGEALDHRADLFSLGSVMYAMLTGRPPFRAETTLAVLKRVAEDAARPMREVIPEVPEWLCRIVEKLHAKDPAERFQTAKEVADLLADCEKQLAAHKELRDDSRIPEAPKAARADERRARNALIAAGLGIPLVFALCSLLNASWPLVLFTVVVTGVGIGILLPTRGAARPAAGRSRKWAAAALALALVLALGGFWFGRAAVLYATNRGELELVPQDGLTDVIVLENPEGVIDGNKLHPAVTDWLGMTDFQRLKLPPGKYQLNAGAQGRIIHWEVTTSGPFGSRTLLVPGEGHVGWSVIVTVGRGERTTVRPVISKPTPEPSPPKPNDGFVSLFNGKDLAGWRKAFGVPEAWAVRDGAIVGTGPLNCLSTERQDYRDFHLRAEVKLSAGGEAGIYLRGPIGFSHGVVAAQILGGPAGNPTGTLLHNSELLARPAAPVAIPPDEWFTFEVIAQGKHVETRVNGRLGAVTEAAPLLNGPIGLASTARGTTVQFRKVELKELPRLEEPPAPGREDLARLDGRWSLDVAKVGDREWPAKAVPAMELHFGANTRTFDLLRGDLPERHAGTFEIDAEKRELLLTLDGHGVFARCAYRFDGDRLALDFPQPRDGKAGNTEFFAPDPHTASARNLKKIGLAMHMHAEANESRLPRAALTSAKAKDGKPLLSWRVALLPFLGEDELYKEFKLDESWDSDHNKKLIEKMPKVYAAPGILYKEPGLTHYQAFAGPGTAFEPLPGLLGVRLGTDFPDGMADTILVAESREPVVWTKPHDLPFDPKKPLPKLGWFSAGAHVLMGDGSVARLAPDAPDAFTKAYVTRNGNETPQGKFMSRLPYHGPAVKLELRRANPQPGMTAPDREDLAKLKGEWLVRLTGGVPANGADTLAIRFGDGDFVFRFPRGAKPQAGTFQVDAANKQLLLKFAGQPTPVRCAYRVEGDSLRLTLAGSPGTEAARPLTADEFLHARALIHAVNNIKQQAIALHNYHDARQMLPPAARVGKDGKPLLSWRVLVLPYIGEDELYKQFKLDEPWDSEHNKKLIEKMPPQFASPHRKPTGPGLTHFRVFVGPGTAFEPQTNREQGIRLQDVTDGAMTTLLVAEAADAVIWTKPDELPFDPKGKLPKLGTPEEGALVTRCDASVMMLAPNPPDEALRAFITRNGGEPVPDLPLKPNPLQSRPVYLECERPPAAPPLAVAPFDANKAKAHQDAWAKHLSVPVEYENPAGVKLRLIPPGEFTMGSSKGEIEWLLTQAHDLKDAEGWLKDYVRKEGPERRVTVREPFLLGTYEVTVGQFREFVKATGYKTEAEKSGGGRVWDNDAKKWFTDPGAVWDSPKYSGGENHPVVFMTPADAKAFCAWLSSKDGLNYVLPTEEQWEYACRAGTATRWWFGDDDAMKAHGWTVPHSTGKHHPVGQKAANPFGLYDVHGNATELVLTPQGNVYERGGQANETPQRARSAWRYPVEKVTETHGRRGFRVAVVGDLKPKKPSPGATGFGSLDSAKIPEAERMPWLPKGTVAVIGSHKGGKFDARGRLELGPDKKPLAPEAPVTSRHYGPVVDGQRVITFLRNGNKGHAWSIRDGAFRQDGDGFPRPGSAPSLSPNGALLAGNGPDTHVHVYERGKEGFVLKTSLGGSAAVAAERIEQRAWHPNGTSLLTAYGDGSIDLWDLSPGRRSKKSLGTFPRGGPLVMAPDGKTMFRGNALWDVSGPTPKARKLPEFGKEQPASAAFTPDGKLLVGYNSDAIRVFDPADPGEGEEFCQAKEGGRYIQLSPDGGRVLANNRDTRLTVWDVKSRALLLDLPLTERGWEETATQAAWLDDRHFVWGQNGVVYVIRVPDPPKPPAKKEPDLAVIQPLRDVVAARGRSAADAKTRFEVGKTSKIEWLAAEAELREAQAELAEAEGDEPIQIRHLRELVKLRQEERDLIAERVKVGVDAPDVLNKADARLAKARAARAKVDPPQLAPPPRAKLSPPEAAPPPRRKP